jgi:hypothetical protein
MARTGGTSAWEALWAMNPMSAMVPDPMRIWGSAASPPAGSEAEWPVDPVAVATAALETWRWLVNAQVDLALGALAALRR